MLEALEARGYVLAPGLLTRRESVVAARALERVSAHGAGTRNLFGLPWCRALAKRVRARLVKASALSDSAVAVQCTLFDKTPKHNWLVTLHQDFSIPVCARVHHPSLGVWSEKEREHFVQAPPELLETLLAVRVHVDDCGVENGPLRVVPGSHCGGRLTDAAAFELRSVVGESPCLVKSGDALLMRPLLLHASSKASVPSRRRVLHLLFGPPTLPFGLEWKHAV